MSYSEEIVGRLDSLCLNNEAAKKLGKEWSKYEQYIKKGGEPQRVDKYCRNKSTFQPLVLVHRRDFTNPLIFKTLIGWRHMPLKNFDIVRTMEMSVGIEMIAANCFAVCRQNSIIQVTDKNAYSLSPKDLIHIINNPSDTHQRGSALSPLNSLTIFQDPEKRMWKSFEWSVRNPGAMSIKG